MSNAPPKTSKPKTTQTSTARVRHLSLAWRPIKRPSKQQMLATAREALKALDLFHD